MNDDDPLFPANNRRLADAKANHDKLWEAVKRFVVEIRQQMPTRGVGTAADPFPSIPVIVESLNFDGLKTSRGNPVNYNTVSRLLTERYDEWKAIPSAQEMEDALPSPDVHLWGRFRLLEDVGEFSAGDYGQVIEINEHGIIGFLTDWDSVKISQPEHMELLIRPHQMRMVASDLTHWFSLSHLSASHSPDSSES